MVKSSKVLHICWFNGRQSFRDRNGQGFYVEAQANMGLTAGSKAKQLVNKAAVRALAWCGAGGFEIYLRCTFYV